VNALKNNPFIVYLNEVISEITSHIFNMRKEKEKRAHIHTQTYTHYNQISIVDNLS
jgi:hypothetical protein